MPVIVSAKGTRFLGMAKQAAAFQAAVPLALRAAADEATSVSRTTFRAQLGGRPLAPSRPGRPSTGGGFANDIEWQPSSGGGVDSVVLDLDRLPPYVFIQEIGTGKSARITNPPGSVTVRSQYGRLISANLYWASGPGSPAKGATGGARDDQLYFASELNSVSNVRRRRKRIRREIKGKHFIADGGRAGFVQLRDDLTDEAKRIFR